jgi:tellurite resistance protein
VFRADGPEPVDVVGLADPTKSRQDRPAPAAHTVPTEGTVMTKQRANGRWRAREAAIVATYQEDREDEVLDAIVSAAALIARADGWVQEVERGQLFDFLDRQDFLSAVAREDVLAQFERCVRELREPGGPSAVIERLGRHRDRPTAALILGVGEEVAAADCRLDPREEQLLSLIRAGLEGRAL